MSIISIGIECYIAYYRNSIHIGKGPFPISMGILFPKNELSVNYNINEDIDLILFMLYYIYYI